MRSELEGVGSARVGVVVARGKKVGEAAQLLPGWGEMGAVGEGRDGDCGGLGEGAQQSAG